MGLRRLFILFPSLWLVAPFVFSQDRPGLGADLSCFLLLFRPRFFGAVCRFLYQSIWPYQLVGCFGFLTSSSTTRLYRGRAPRQERLTILRAATHETELGDHDFCLSRSHYTDTDPTSRERAATAGIEPGSSSPGVARSTAELPRPHQTCAQLYSEVGPIYAIAKNQFIIWEK